MLPLNGAARSAGCHLRRLAYDVAVVIQDAMRLDVLLVKALKTQGMMTQGPATLRSCCEQPRRLWEEGQEGSVID